MNKLLVVCRHEYIQVVKKKSFVLGIVLTPLVMAAMMLLPSYFATKESDTAETMVIVDRSGAELGDKLATRLGEYTLPETADPAYQVQRIVTFEQHESTEQELLLDSLKNAISDRTLEYVLVFNPNATSTSDSLYLITNSGGFRTIRRFERSLTDVMSELRVSQANLGVEVDSVLSLTNWVDIALHDTQGEAIPFRTRFFTAMILVMMIYIMILVYGATLMRSVIEEKNSRIMEVLVSSASPFDLMLGKVLGLGAAAFTQVAIWVACGAVLFLAGGAMSLAVESNVARLIFNPVIVIFFVLFFVSGYILYSTIFALVGSIVNSDKESQAFIMPISFALMVSVMIGPAMQTDASKLWAVIMSLIPFFTPTLMMMRLLFVAPEMTSYSFTSGILMEATLGFIIIIITIFGMVWLAARIFRIGILMYGKRPTLPEIIKWIRY